MMLYSALQRELVVLLSHTVYVLTRPGHPYVCALIQHTNTRDLFAAGSQDPVVDCWRQAPRPVRVGRLSGMITSTAMVMGIACFIVIIIPSIAITGFSFLRFCSGLASPASFFVPARPIRRRNR
jgi:hypothetical protein